MHATYQTPPHWCPKAYAFVVLEKLVCRPLDEKGNPMATHEQIVKCLSASACGVATADGRGRISYDWSKCGMR